MFYILRGSILFYGKFIVKKTCKRKKMKTKVYGTNPVPTPFNHNHGLPMELSEALTWDGGPTGLKDSTYPSSSRMDTGRYPTWTHVRAHDHENTNSYIQLAKIRQASELHRQVARGTGAGRGK